MVANGSGERLIPLVRILLGLVYLINGTNWFFKIITPYPSISDFIHFMPPPDIVGAMIEHGILFHLAKGMEVVGGLMLLTNRFVPLALVLSGVHR
ncbi:MAG: DoxX family membrane protein [Sphingomonadales bacterium]|nr:DoxX family membrane protein [Sphingomonadales bacterium]